jgi:hypothetical protein
MKDVTNAWGGGLLTLALAACASDGNNDGAGNRPATTSTESANDNYVPSPRGSGGGGGGTGGAGTGGTVGGSGGSGGAANGSQRSYVSLRQGGVSVLKIYNYPNAGREIAADPELGDRLIISNYHFSDATHGAAVVYDADATASATPNYAVVRYDAAAQRWRTLPRLPSEPEDPQERPLAALALADGSVVAYSLPPSDDLKPLPFAKCSDCKLPIWRYQDTQWRRLAPQLQSARISSWAFTQLQSGDPVLTAGTSISARSLLDYQAMVVTGPGGALQPMVTNPGRPGVFWLDVASGSIDARFGIGQALAASAPRVAVPLAAGMLLFDSDANSVSNRCVLDAGNYACQPIASNAEIVVPSARGTPQGLFPLRLARDNWVSLGNSNCLFYADTCTADGHGPYTFYDAVNERSVTFSIQNPSTEFFLLGIIQDPADDVALRMVFVDYDIRQGLIEYRVSLSGGTPTLVERDRLADYFDFFSNRAFGFPSAL